MPALQKEKKKKQEIGSTSLERENNMNHMAVQIGEMSETQDRFLSRVTVDSSRAGVSAERDWLLVGDDRFITDPF